MMLREANREGFMKGVVGLGWFLGKSWKPLLRFLMEFVRKM